MGESATSIVSDDSVDADPALSCHNGQIEEMSVVDDSELAVDPLSDVLTHLTVVSILKSLNNDELESRLADRQGLPPLAADAVSTALRHFDDSHPLLDTDCIIPEDQERELDEQEGWGAEPTTHSELPTDSELIDQNGSVSMLEPENPSLASNAGDSRLNARGATQRSNPASLETSGVDESQPLYRAVDVGQQFIRFSDTESESEDIEGDKTQGVASPHVNRSGVSPDSAAVKPVFDNGSSLAPIDLTNDDGDETIGNLDATRPIRAPTDDSQLFTQQGSPVSPKEEQVDDINAAYDDYQLFTQPPEPPSPSSSETTPIRTEASSSLRSPHSVEEHQPDLDPHQSDEMRMGETERSSSRTSPQKSVGQPDGSHSNSEARAPTGSSDVYGPRSSVGAPPKPSGPVHSGGLGGFFRRLASNLGMTSPEKDTDDSEGKANVNGDNQDDYRDRVDENGVVVDRELSEDHAASDDSDAGHEDNDESEYREDDEETQTEYPRYDDAEMWHTQADYPTDMTEHGRASPLPSSPIADDHDIVGATPSSLETSDLGIPMNALAAERSGDNAIDERRSGNERIRASAAASSEATGAANPDRALEMNQQQSATRRSNKRPFTSFMSTSPPSPDETIVSRPVSKVGDQGANTALETTSGQMQQESSNKNATGNVPKRRRQEPALNQQRFQSAQSSTAGGFQAYAHTSLSGLSSNRSGIYSMFSVAPPGSSQLRGSKRYEAMLPAFNMDKLKQMLANKKQ